MINYLGMIIPVFMIIMIIEWRYSAKLKNERYNLGNTAMNMAIGAVDQIGSLLTFVLLYFVLDFVYNHINLFKMENTWRQWLLAYIVVDFLSYWYHRFSHEINLLWAGHVTHHSSTLFNFSNAFRTSVFQGLNRIPFWAILPVFGFSPLVLLAILKISGIYDFFVHTSYIPKLGFLEKILITPSAHRVHHGKNDLYIDKNYGSTFVIWDKLFGTYQEETETVIFGIKGDYKDDHPLSAIGFHYKYLFNVILSTPWGMQKFKVLFMPPGYLPNTGLNPARGISKTIHSQGNQLKGYAIFQLMIGFCLFNFLIVCYDIILEWVSFLLAIVICNSVFKSAMILKNNIDKGFIRREVFCMAFFSLAVLFLLLVYYNVYLWLILVCNIASLIFIMFCYRKLEKMQKTL